MKKLPKTYFSTPLSKSARDTEGRIRNIFQGQRKRPAVLMLALVAAVTLLCGSVVAVRSRDKEEPETAEESTGQWPDRVSVEGGAAFRSAPTPVFSYNGVDYDLSELEDGLINAIMDVRPAGQYYVIDGHGGPKNGMYCVFDTQSETFVKSFPGTHLIWRDDDLSTAVYCYGGEVRDYDGNVLFRCSLSEWEYIYSLALSEDGEQIVVDIFSDEGNDRTETYYRSGYLAERTARFTDVMGLDGAYTEYWYDAGRQCYRSYYSNGVLIATSSGAIANDTVVDLDGDGVTELVRLATTDDGKPSGLYVYRRNGGVIEVGRLMDGIAPVSDRDSLRSGYGDMAFMEYCVLDPRTWQEAYINYIRETSAWDSSDRYALIDLDGDEPPELFRSGGYEASGETVATFYDGTLRTRQLSRIGSLYIEGSGLVYSNNGHMGYYPVEIVKLERGEFLPVGAGLHTNERQGSDDGAEAWVDTYEWEGEPTSEAEFYEKIDAIFERERGVTPSPLYSTDEMLALLGVEAISFAAG